jgi:hypothetical protein
MPRYIIERQYLLPVYEHLLIEADSLAGACREALDEIAHPWTEEAEHDFDNARPVIITEAVVLPEGLAAQLPVHEEVGGASLAHFLYSSGLVLLPIPAEFQTNADDGEPRGFS